MWPPKVATSSCSNLERNAMSRTAQIAATIAFAVAGLTAAGAQQANFVRLRLNDKVLVELASHDKTRGRIVKVL